MMCVISDYQMPFHAREYFGGDVQRFWIERSGARAPFQYTLKQRPHWLPVRVAARCYAMTAAEARAVFTRMAGHFTLAREISDDMDPEDVA